MTAIALANLPRTCPSVPVKFKQKNLPLPLEIINTIFEMLSAKDQQKASFTCKQLRLIGLNFELQRDIKIALKKTINPSTDALHSFAKVIFEMKSAVTPIKLILNNIEKLPLTSSQNQVIDTLIASWKSQNDEGRFLRLLKVLYTHKKCSNANRLHLLGLTRKGELLEKYEKVFVACIFPINSPNIEGRLADSTFTCKAVDTKLYPNLVISAKNTFKNGEIVAVDHAGNLTGGRKNLFYGVVQEGDNTCYRITGMWYGTIAASPAMLGKISRDLPVP